MSETQASLNITDISEAVKLIDFAADQGIFKGWRAIRHALSLRERLDGFVNAANTQVNIPPVALDEAVGT